MKINRSKVSEMLIAKKTNSFIKIFNKIVDSVGGFEVATRVPSPDEMIFIIKPRVALGKKYPTEEELESILDKIINNIKKGLGKGKKQKPTYRTPSDSKFTQNRKVYKFDGVDIEMTTKIEYSPDSIQIRFKPINPAGYGNKSVVQQ